MSDYPEKPKRKIGQVNSRLDSVLIYLGVKPSPIEFMINASLETCMARLKSKVQTEDIVGYSLNRATVEVSLYQTDDEHCRFRVLKKQYREPDLEIIGHLEQLSATTTYMTGSLQTEFLSIILLIPIVIIAAVIIFIFGFVFASVFPFDLLFVFPLLVVPASIIINLAADRRMLIHYFENVLLVDTHKKKNEWT